MNEFMDEEFGVDLSDLVSEDDGNQTEEETSEEAAEANEEEQEPSEEPEEPAGQPEAEPTKEQKEEELFDLKFNKEIRKVSRQEVTELAQKGLNHDRILEQRDHLQQENAELLKFKQDNEAIIGLLDAAAQKSGTDRNTFLQSVRENAYVSQGLSRDAAHERVLREDAEQRLSRTEQLEAAKNKGQQEQELARQQDIERFLKVYKDVDPGQIPKEVWDDVRGGETLVSAYGRYENRQLAESNRKLQESINALKQNEKNKQKSIGSAKTEGKETAKDPFLEYLFSDD
jgi:hypothetical protein|nr:MAG TPA: hypothetical protein [Caudoviricetes sp.]